MKSFLYLFLPLLLALCVKPASAVTLLRQSVHDPSVVWDPGTGYYYIFGSHHAVARTKNLMSWAKINYNWSKCDENGNVVSTNTGIDNSTAFQNHATRTVTVGGEQVAFGNFNAYAYVSAYANGYSIDGNLWAPDVIYNPTMQKWCMYMSLNGPHWNSCIVLLTADKINGPYLYQGPVVFTGFGVNTATVNYKMTDLQIALGSLSSLPIRYNRGNKWGDRWPHAIDPCVFYDEDGQLWMSYGSWSGGIWMLKLNAENGLRDYDVKYPITNGDADGVTSDPYFGKKIAGGFYASGEGSYIEHIGNYYYLFVSNGGLAAGGDANDYNNGGYQMRVFRSVKPDGPYRDGGNRSPILNGYEKNFGPNCSTRGMNIFGAYTDWGKQTVGDFGERSQGHNSIIDAADGRTYLIYHTRFQNRGEAFEVRVHQVFQNKDGWLCAAPFEYTGETVTNNDIATRQVVRSSYLPATYHLLVHRYGLDHRKKEAVTPVDIALKYDGTVEGAYTGTWQLEPGTSYITIKLGTTTYKGVVVEQKLEPSDDIAVCFTATASNGVSIWGQQVEGTATGISDMDKTELTEVRDNMENETLYDLTGRRISPIHHNQTPNIKNGLYIRNGRKIMVK